MNLLQKISDVENQFLNVKIVFGQGAFDARDEATWIVFKILGIELDCLFNGAEIDWQDDISGKQIASIDQLVSMRLETRKPLAYLINEAWFGGRKFYVDERVIIPRSYLIEWIPDAFEPWVRADGVNAILDMCCGSGCIAISCAYAFPKAKILASDLSTDALAVAKINVDRHDLVNRVALHHGNGLDGIENKFDLILCNPPYVSSARIAQLPQEYKMEPDLAFRGGDDGLEFIAPLLQQAKRYLTDNGSLVVEAGSAANALEQKFPEVPFCWLSTEDDEKAVFIITREELLEYENIIQFA